MTAIAALLALVSPQDPPLTAEEARAFMLELATYVRERHLKRDGKSPQAGMVYEYVDVARIGKTGQWIQGEALDTMHDGAWFASACAQAYRITGDPLYAELLNKWIVPFYLKMLNQSNTLFTPERDDSAGQNKFGKEHLLIKGERGFVPYWWDDGASVSLEAGRRKSGKGAYPCRDEAAKPNPEFRLSGYSLGCSNHLAQDLAVMLLAVWPLSKPPNGPVADHRDGIAEAAGNLFVSRMKHHGPIPVIAAAAGHIVEDTQILNKTPEYTVWAPDNDYVRLLQTFDPARRISLPVFTDNQEYFYWQTAGRLHGKVDRPAAMRIVYDAFTLPMLFRFWSDDAPVAPGMNVSETGAGAKDGKFEFYRSDRRVGTGSRMGPQNMIGCGRALQLLKTYPGLWEERYSKFDRDLRVRFAEGPVAADGVKEPPYSDDAKLGKLKVALLADREALSVAGEFEGDAAAFTLCSEPEGKGRKAEVAVKKDGAVQAKGEGGAALECQSSVKGNRFEVRLPWHANKKQGPWWTGVEHGRHSVKSGEDARNFYLASSEESVKRALLAELSGGLRTWREVFKQKGFIPAKIDSKHLIADTSFDTLSDSGGYAHLIAAGAQYLIYVENKRDWEEAVGSK